MKLRKRLRVWFVPIANDLIDIPDNARIERLEFRDALGLGGQREVAGAWVSQVVTRYDDDNEMSRLLADGQTRPS